MNIPFTQLHASSIVPFVAEHWVRQYKTPSCNIPASCHNRWRYVDNRPVMNCSQESYSTPSDCASHQTTVGVAAVARAITLVQKNKTVNTL